MTTPRLDRHGFVTLFTGQPHLSLQVYEALLRAGFAAWDSNGLPLFTVMESHATKAQWFEAGYLAGAGVPLFLIGADGRFKKRHKEVISRLGGWCMEIEGEVATGLIAAIARRGLAPTDWDAKRCEEALRKLQERLAMPPLVPTAASPPP